ncbi:alpha-hydroxy acid oxidase [Tepidimonas ignava]|uniref:alpha-hydroxy acid oxidase n=1 Tax=Tepidimonas ignava TaxID=114249 RepID=UPI002FDAA367
MTPATAPHAAAAPAPSGLSAAARAYLLGGAGEQRTLQANVAAWRAFTWWPRVLATPPHVSATVELLGRRWPAPWLAAPMAHLLLAHPQAELGLALACAAQGAGLVLSTQATVPLERVARAVLPEPTRGPLWFQLYPYGEPTAWLHVADRAAQACYEAIVLTVDAPVQWTSPQARAAGFALPADWPQPNLPAGAPHGTLDALLRCALRWDDVAWLRQRCPLPLVLKGILHPADARHACDAGLCDAIIVSNHGGRVLDGLPATALALPGIVQSVGGRVPVLVDGGLRSAADVAVALALGARAVLVGRPLIEALASAGPAGVAALWRQWHDELRGTMALLGCAEPAALHPNLLRSPAPTDPNNAAPSQPERSPTPCT